MSDLPAPRISADYLTARLGTLTDSELRALVAGMIGYHYRRRGFLAYLARAMDRVKERGGGK
jgi:hypothetical protein